VSSGARCASQAAAKLALRSCSKRPPSPSPHLRTPEGSEGLPEVPRCPTDLTPDHALTCVVHHGGVRVTGSRVETVYREEGTRLWRAVLAYSADADLASDAVAETFAQALAHEEEIRDVSGWVWKTAFRIARGALAERRRFDDRVPEGTYQMTEGHHEVFEALKVLSPNQRLAVLLHDYADRPASEIARTMQISRATVYVHLSQGRRRLRGALEDHDG
jgi:RNA polymerase sigma-70 factor (ECF subfamily)